MPEASPELRNAMMRYFGDAIDDGPPTAYLRKMGWTNVRGVWTDPPIGRISEKEWDCVYFLCHEWDETFVPRRR
jgi:hypothetical protein